MKKIEAYVKSQRTWEVIELLHEIEGLTGVSITGVKGFGRTRKKGESIHIVDTSIDQVSHVKIEIFCKDDVADGVVAAIQRGAHTGLRADGKIYVSHIEDAIRISTGERGENAV